MWGFLVYQVYANIGYHDKDPDGGGSSVEIFIEVLQAMLSLSAGTRDASHTYIHTYIHTYLSH